MNRSRPLVLALSVVLAAGLLGGCGADDEDRPTATGRLVDLSAFYPPPSEGLDSALRVDGSSAVGFTGNGPFLQPGSSTVHDGVALVASDAGVTAYDTTSHGELWSTPLPGRGACRVSPVVDGRVAVLTGRRSCDAVAVLDVRTGAERWRRDLGEATYVFDFTLALSADSVYAAGECGAVLRFDPATGRPQEPYVPVDDECGHDAASRGSVVATYDGEGRLRALDVVTGRTLLDRSLDTEATELHGVVSTDPLVLDVTERGIRTLQRHDHDGEPLGTLGARLSSTDDFTVWAQTDGVLVGSYAGVSGYRAYDVDSGDELWRTTGDRWLAGADSRGLVWTQTTRVTRAGAVDEVGAETQVLRSSPTDPEDAALLGAVATDGTYSLVVADDLLLDGEGTSAVVPLGEGVGPAPAPYDAYEAQVQWGPDDVRPDETLDFCDAVATEDLEVVGLRTDLPAPVDCDWSEGNDPSYLEKSLTVDVVVSQPGADEDGEPVPGTDMAAAAYAEEHRRWAPLDGLGDEASSRSTQSATGQDASAAIDVRAGNVTLRVESAVSALTPQRTRGAVPAARLEQVVLDVAADVLAGLDLPVDPEALPEPGEVGPVAEAPDVCRAVGALGAEVAGPLATRADYSPDDPALSSCSWGVDFDDPGTTVQVTAFAVPPGVLPDGDGEVPSAVEAARALRLQGRRFPAAGPDARYRSSDDVDSLLRSLSVREDDLVVRVSASAYEEPLADPGALDADMVRLAERVLDATLG